MEPAAINKEVYLDSLAKWLVYYGFTNEKSQYANEVYKRTRFEASKFGNADNYIFVIYFPELSVENFRKYSSAYYNEAARIRTGAPLMFGAALVVYPLFIVDKITSELYKEIKTYCPKHMGSAEFPCILDLRTSYLYYYEQTPVWGYAYYARYRQDSFNFFCPQAWRQISEK